MSKAIIQEVLGSGVFMLLVSAVASLQLAIYLKQAIVGMTGVRLSYSQAYRFNFILAVISACSYMGIEILYWVILNSLEEKPLGNQLYEGSRLAMMHPSYNLGLVIGANLIAYFVFGRRILGRTIRHPETGPIGPRKASLILLPIFITSIILQGFLMFFRGCR